MITEYRRDLGQLRPPRRLPNGALVVDATLSRSGVFEYRRADGSVRKEYRPPEEVFHPDALSSFSFAPITDDHPTVAVTTMNARDFARGSVGEKVRRDGDFVVASLVVTDGELIAKIEAGKQEVSSGYLVIIDMTEGVTPEGERYDVVQRRIRGNHVAIVEQGRAGPEVRLRMDEMAMVGQVARPITPCYSEDTMSTDVNKFLSERLDKTENQLSEAHARADKAEARADSAVSRANDLAEKLAEETKRADEAEAQRDSATARADAAENPDTMRAAITARVELENSARHILGPDYKFDGKDEAKVIEDTLDKLSIKLDSSKSADYRRARFDAETERFRQSGDSLTEVITDSYDAPSGNRYDRRPAPNTDIRALKAAHRAREQNRWKEIGKSGAANAKARN